MDEEWVFKFNRKKQIEGEPVTLDEAEEYLLAKLNESGGDRQKARSELVIFYGNTGRDADAMRYAEEYLAECDDPGDKAEMCFRQGQLMEHVMDWESAIRFYSKALEIGSRADIDRYFIHNDIGFALNQLERYAEAELHLREAIRLDETRPNAFKNLGLSLEGQGKFGEAALCYITATRANASDPRALKHLEELAKRHKEAYADVPDLDYQIFKCREAVEYALSQQPPSPFRTQKKGGQGRPN